MSDQPDTKNSNVGAKRTILRVMVPVILFIAGLLLLVNPILNTPFVSDRISRFLSDTLHQPAAVRGIRLSGGSILINGLDIMNPPGFPPGKVIAVGYLEISPEWRSLMAGMRAFTSIRVHGLRLSLDKKGDGTWNFTGLTSLLRGKKGGAEVFIRSLLLEEGSISVAGRGVRDISLAVSDLSSKGSTTSRILLTFSDDYGDRLRVAGKGRAGVKPEFDMELSAPLCSFRWLRGSGLPIDPEKGRWKLKLDAALHDGELKINGKAAVNSLSLKISGEESIHGGSLAFAGHYGLNRDTAVVDSCILELDGALRLHATGKIEQLRRERLYSIVIEQEGFRLEDVFRLFPPGVRRDLHPRGEVLPAAFRLSGSSGNGIAAASGEVSIRGMGLSSGKRPILESLQADARIAGGRGGWELTGKVSQPKPSAGSLLRFSDTPFKLSMDGRFRPISGGGGLAATFAGVPLRGSFLYRDSDPEPISAHLELAHGSLAEFSRSFPLPGSVVTKGTVDASINARGSLTGGLRYDAATTVSGLQGKFGDRKIALGKLTADASGVRNSGGLSASGRVAASGGEMDARNFSFSIPCSLRGGVITIAGADCLFDKALFQLGELDLSFPGGMKARVGRKMPIGLRFKGVKISREGSGAGDISGEIHATLSTLDGKLQMDGDGALKAPVIFYKDKNAGTLSALFRANGSRGMLEATGEIVGGRLVATAEGDPANLHSGLRFSMNITGLSGSRLADIAGKAYPVKLSGGNFDLTARGDLGSENVLRSRIAFAGRDIALSGKNGRTFFKGGTLDLSADLAKGDLFVRDAVATVGGKFRIELKGTLKNAAVPEREGDFSLEVPRVEVASLLDSFANALPPALQEAEASGSMAIRSNIKTRGNLGRMTGEIDLEVGQVEIPSQKLTVTGIKGEVPFDMELSAKAAQQWDKGGLKRDNYQKMLTLLQAGSKEGHNFIIERIIFGTTEFADTRLLIVAANGVTEIRSLGSRFFRGEILGRGSFSLAGGGRYGGDILVHDLSLRDLCDAYPSIKGYLSGRVDGFASLYGEGKTLGALKGFMEFWSRSDVGEKMLISKEFLQKLSGKKLKGMFFTNDRPYDRGEISAYLESGYLTFQTLDISHTNLFGIRDLSVTVAPVQNKISLDHLLASIREAASRGKAATGGGGGEQSPPATEFKWEQ